MSYVCFQPCFHLIKIRLPVPLLNQNQNNWLDEKEVRWAKELKPVSYSPARREPLNHRTDQADIRDPTETRGSRRDIGIKK